MNKELYECPCGCLEFNILLSEELQCINCKEIFSIKELKVYNASKQGERIATEITNQDS